MGNKKKRAKKAEYSEWLLEKEEPNFLVYIITGAVHWKKEFMETLTKKYKTGYTLLTKDVEVDLKRAKYRPMGKRKHLLMYEPIDKMQKHDVAEIVTYSRNPSTHAVLIISVNNWRDKKGILSNFRYIENSKTIKLFDLDYPSSTFIKSYIRDICSQNNLTFESKTVFETLFRRLRSEPKEIVANIEALSSFTNKADKESVIQYTEDYSSYTYNRLYDTIINLDRVRVPYISYNDLLESGRKSVTIMINIRKHLDMLFQAKYLKQKGILRKNDIIEFKKRLYDNGDLKFPTPNIWNESDYRINQYIESSEKISLGDLLYMMDLIDRSLKSVGYLKARGTAGANDRKTKHIRPEEDFKIFRVFLELLDRRDVEYEYDE